jgi:signal transduction histidine kinase
LQPLDPLPVVRRAADFCGPEFEKRHVSFTVDDRAPDSRIDADEDHLYQVFLNLFLNALDAMPSGGNIRIVRDVSDAEMLIRVSDTGAGIPREIQDKIFNPFFTTKEHGTGLGLAKVFTIMENHHGRVELNSAQGEGTTFTLAFPIKAPI